MTAPQGNELALEARGVLGGFALDVAFAAPLQGVIGLFGPSGCGKTSVLRCVAGLERLGGRLSVAGQVWHDDASGVFLPPHRRPIGYVFQEASLFPHLTVRRNLEYGLRRVGVGGPPSFDDVVALMGLAPLLARAPARLSGGERQRVAVGRALLVRPRLMLMDEPLAALDRDSKDEILPFLERLPESLALPVMYVSHDLPELERLADHLVLLRSGRVLASGALQALLTDTDLPLATGRGAAAVLDARVTATDPDGVSTLAVRGGHLLVSGPAGPVGRRHRVRVAATDVSIAGERPSRTTILNVLPGVVREVVELDSASANVVVALGERGEGSDILARVSRRSVTALELGPGLSVFAQVKGVSLSGLRGDPL